MNRAKTSLCAVLLLATVGCDTAQDARPAAGPDPAATDWQDIAPAPVPKACAAADEPLRRAANVYDVLRHSVHELVVCGGIQVGVARSIILAIIRSNPQAITPDLAKELGGSPADKLAHAADGSWRMNMPGMPGSVFSIRFFEPDGVKLVKANLFRLDSYLKGVQVTRDKTTEEMMLAPGEPTTYSFKWQSLGPLGHLLNGGQKPANPIVVQLTVLDLLKLSTLSLPAEQLAAFGSLLDLKMTAKATVQVVRDGVLVEYGIDALAASLGTVSEAGSIDFGALQLKATDGVVALDVTDQSLGYADAKGLLGYVDFQATGKGLSVRVRSDFGDGASYPDDKWSCP